MSFLKELEDAKEVYATMLAQTEDKNKIYEYSNKIRLLDIQIDKAKNEKTFWIKDIPIRLNMKILTPKASGGL